MIKLKEKSLENEMACPYIEGNISCNEYFLAHGLHAHEIEHYLETGWRKFGIYFFRPKCINCTNCVPIRVTVDQFAASKSQRRVWKKNGDIKIVVNDLHYRDEIYDLYRFHSEERFGQKTDPELFRYSHFVASCPAKQIEFFLADELVAVGFLDVGTNSLSSVYFIFHPITPSAAWEFLEFWRKLIWHGNWAFPTTTWGTG